MGTGVHVSREKSGTIDERFESTTGKDVLRKGKGEPLFPRRAFGEKRTKGEKERDVRQPSAGEGTPSSRKGKGQGRRGGREGRNATICCKSQRER